MASMSKGIGWALCAAWCLAWPGAAAASDQDDAGLPLTDSQIADLPHEPDHAAEAVADVPTEASKGPLGQRSKIGGVVAWNFNVPIGSVRDFAENVSPVGLEVQLRYWALPQVSFALGGEWDSYGDVRPRNTYELESGAVTAKAYNNLFTSILRFIPTYYFNEDGPVLPYVAPNIGVAFSRYRSKTADLELSDDAVSIAYGLEAGVLIPMPHQGPMFLFQVRYTALPASEFKERTSDAQSIGLLGGVAF
jgi:hypothetical protein